MHRHETLLCTKRAVVWGDGKEAFLEEVSHKCGRFAFPRAQQLLASHQLLCDRTLMLTTVIESTIPHLEPEQPVTALMNGMKKRSLLVLN